MKTIKEIQSKDSIEGFSSNNSAKLTKSNIWKFGNSYKDIIEPNSEVQQTNNSAREEFIQYFNNINSSIKKYKSQKAISDNATVKVGGEEDGIKLDDENILASRGIIIADQQNSGIVDSRVISSIMKYPTNSDIIPTNNSNILGKIVLGASSLIDDWNSSDFTLVNIFTGNINLVGGTIISNGIRGINDSDYEIASINMTLDNIEGVKPLGHLDTDFCG